MRAEPWVGAVHHNPHMPMVPFVLQGRLEDRFICTSQTGFSYQAQTVAREVTGQVVLVGSHPAPDIASSHDARSVPVAGWDTTLASG